MAGRVYPGRGGAWLFLLLAGCIWDKALYDERKALLTDDDGDGFTELAGDCDDGDDRVNPDVVERCDGVDQDCDQLVDEDAADAPRWFVDGDGDGLGGGAEQSGCVVPSGAVVAGGDCDDTTQAIPGAEVPYDGVDQDCDGADLVDVDGDGSAGGPTGMDCDDADAAVHPGAEETWENGATDNDCDGGREGVTFTYGYEGWIGPSAGSAFGRRLARAADWDGDGSDEILASAWNESSRAAAGGAVYLLAGAAGRAVDAHAAYATDAGSLLGTAYDAGGDVDGDGVGDLAVSATAWSAGTGAVWLASGAALLDSDVSLPTEAIGEIRGEAPETYVGSSVGFVGDVDGDGVAELAVGATFAFEGGEERAGAVGLWDASPPPVSEFVDAPSMIRGTFRDALVGTRVEVAGDQDGDGYVDLLVGSGSGVLGQVFAGGPTLGEGADRVLFTLYAGYDGVLGSAFMLGDLDGDGRREMGCVATDLSIFFALSGAVTNTLDYPGALVRDLEGSYIGQAQDAGDLDGDGRDEVFVPLFWDETRSTGIATLHFGADLAFGSVAAVDEPALTAVSVRPAAHFGASALVGGDVDGDGAPDIVLGGDADDEGGEDAGAVTVFPLPQ